MADDEQFSLCWNNFNTNLSAGFHESLCRGDLVDVSLAAEGHIVKAHRLVLSVCSPFFRKMFTQMPSNTHAIVFLNNVSHSALKDLIQFMYCGEVNVKQDALPAFISTAESLQIKGLTDNDPAPQAPQPEPTPPPPAAPQHVQQVVSTQRVQRQQPRASARYKIETVDDVLGDEKGTTQIVIQTTAAPQATIVQQQQPAQQHIQQTQQLQPAATTATATLVSSSKRTAQRSSLSGSGAVKRSKTSVGANVIEPLDSNTETANTTTTTQLVPQQITVQTTVVSAASEAKLQQQTARQQSQQAAAQAQAETAEYIDLPIEIPTKSEPDYSEEHGEVAGDGETTYVEDDTYGDMRYDDSYFTENEDAPQTTTGGSGNVTATTSKAVIKQQVLPSYSEAPFGDTSGGEQGNTEAQALFFEIPVPRKRGRPRTKVEDASPKLKLLDKLKAATRNVAASSPAVYASTTKGGVKLIYDGHHFKFSFRKAEYSVFQCCYKDNREECRVRVVCDQKNVFPFDGEHVHFVQASDKSVTSAQFTPGGGAVGASDLLIKEMKVDNDNEDDEQSKQYVEIDDADIEEQVVELLEKPIPDDIADTPAEVKEPREEDPQDFREKIKRRLQRALQNKKK